MAKKPVENEAFYREVDEELRKEQLNETFRRYGWWIIGGVLLLLAAFGGYLYWQNQQQVRAGERGEALVDLLSGLESGRTEGAAEVVEDLASASDGYRAAALFTRANMAIEAGDTAAAVAALAEIADDRALAEPYRNAALVRQTMVEYETLPPQQVIDRLGPLAQADNPWLGSAGEMVAIAHLRLNQPERAGPLFAAVARDENVPPTVRSRAVQMAGALGVDAVADAPAEAAGADEGNKQ